MFFDRRHALHCEDIIEVIADIACPGEDGIALLIRALVGVSQTKHRSTMQSEFSDESSELATVALIEACLISDYTCSGSSISATVQPSGSSSLT
jgi:hypothetical protein